MKTIKFGSITGIALTIALTSLTLFAQDSQNPFFPDLFEADAADRGVSWKYRAVEILARLSLAVLLSGLLVFRPHKNIPLFQRNLNVAQTQILLAVVAAALMMIVGDNAARAFGIFAAVSVVRFRTNIRDPKEITVLLISLALGLAAGVGRWELGLALCLFAILLLRLLERNEQAQVFRAMELKIETANLLETRPRIEEIFKQYGLETEVREIEPHDHKNDRGTVSYYLNIPLNISTSELSDKIMTALSGSIEHIEWETQKHNADIYQ
jgi:uncharacterized membrane protein YhiD involved in acid resistance